MSSIKTVAITDYVDEKLSNFNGQVDNLLNEVKSYADTKVAELVNNAPETMDTIGELATAFTENKEVVDALDEAITKKQDKDKLTTSLSSESTDVQYPSAKAVFDFVNNKPGLKVENGGEIFNDYVDNVASATYSHAEGIKTSATGIAAHAEGDENTANGYTSHVEGKGNLASGDYQHVQGKYNVEDTNNKYAHIVGNGSSVNERSNAHTVDWDGNAEYAGDVVANGCGGENPISLVELSERVSNMQAQSDWEQNDETAPDYIKNRPFYSYEDNSEVIFDGDIAFAQAGDAAAYNFSPELPITDGTSYLVQINDAVITCVCGSSVLLDAQYNSTIGYELLLNKHVITIQYNMSLNFHIKISTIGSGESVVKTLDDKYIPDTILRYEIEETLELPDVSLSSSDDGNGNVVVETSGLEITDDGNGNISITSEHMTVTDNNGNITINV